MIIFDIVQSSAKLRTAYKLRLDGILPEAANPHIGRRENMKTLLLKHFFFVDPPRTSRPGVRSVSDQIEITLFHWLLALLQVR